MYTGSCLCGAVEYSVSQFAKEMGHCHCKMCQKFHGAPFGTYSRVAYADFEFTNGQDSIAFYRSSAAVRRSFCKRCGSSLQYLPDDQDYFALAIATLDQDPGLRPTYQIWTDSKLPWWDLDEKLPAH